MFNVRIKIAKHEKINKTYFKTHGRHVFKDDETKGL